MKKEVFIVRHGRTEFNRLGIWQGSGVDAPLDEEGWKQAKLFFDAYRDEEFDMIVHSSLIRSRQTVEAFSNLEIQTVVAPEINEISWGVQEGKPHTDASHAEYRRVIGEWAIENYSYSFEGGESATDMDLRISKFVHWLKNVNAQKVLVCSHGRAIRALLCIMKKEPLRDMEKYQHHNTGVFKAVLRDDIFVFSEMNDTKHLMQSKARK